MHLNTLDLSQSKQWLTEQQRLSVCEVIQASFAKVDPQDYLAKYFDSPEPYQRKLRLYYKQDQLVGYCLLTFTREANTTVIGASAAFYPDHRQGSNTFQFSLIESFKCWLSSPWRKHYYADTMLSPAMYRAVAKNAGIIWPHFDHQAPKQVFERFNPNGELDTLSALRCLAPVARVSNYSEQDLATLRSNEKPEIRYYCDLNPQFNSGVALFVIIPIHLGQFIRTFWKKIVA